MLMKSQAHLAVLNALAKLEKPEHILVAYSTGADSTALLYLLNDLRKEQGFLLSCVHVNHGLRPASMEEEQLAIKNADNLQIPIVIKRVSIKREGNLEAAAREARYQAFFEAKAELGADLIALAHHAGDQAETLLMHLLSGCGLNGLTGMKEYSPPMWRPLLMVHKDVLMDYLNSRGLPYMEDESNQDEGFTRNYLRRQIIPRLNHLHPGLEQRMAQTANLLDQDEQTLKALTTDWLKIHEKYSPPFHFIDLTAFSLLGLGQKRRVLRAVIKRWGLTLDSEKTHGLLDFCSDPSAARLDLSRQVYVMKSRARLHILRDDVKSVNAHWTQPRALPYTGRFGDGRHEQVMSHLVCKGALMRLPKADDVINPKGMAGRQPVLKYFSSRGMDRAFRPHWPVFAQGREVHWVPGFGISEEAAIKPGETTGVFLEFRDRLPDEIE